MKQVLIRAIRITAYPDLMELYENPMEDACSVSEGDEFISIDAEKPDGFCESAWETLRPFVSELANGGGYFFGSWMKDPHSALLSCNDGFRPVSFLIKALDDRIER